MFGMSMLGDSLMLLIWTAIIFFIIWLALTARSHRLADPGGTALDILKERYAKGEISKEEFETKREALNKN